MQKIDNLLKIIEQYIEILNNTNEGMYKKHISKDDVVSMLEIIKYQLLAEEH